MVLSSSAGYGFVAELGDMVTKNKGGQGVPDGTGRRCGAAAGAGGRGRTPAGGGGDQPGAPAHVWFGPSCRNWRRGKGVKLINVPPAAFKAGEDHVVGVAVLAARDALKVYAGQRYLRLKFKDLQNYRGDRARRGLKLPRGFQRVEMIEVERRG